MSRALCNAHSFTDCGSCYQVDMGSVTRLLSCDIALTLLICVSLFCFVLYQKKRGSCDSTHGRLKQAPSLAKKPLAETPESPYQVTRYLIMRQFIL
ncbi:hypothetical protein N1851_008807 [Merluccius polli]|uniref:TYRO protein tyrosine kinase-binding protein n=1 Tax=Merluccius polli TaxID=89951 RepID=A0AA47P6S0_MERPO|nr:hypothetical protein N1851_008807 [Merluccius polli]